ncbi:MAG TPA: CBS domain-containing protein [Solirubrobacteraceae bacterium]|nr:CBS domain-containing protein [Solirubrobacteraceae bacterium]
MSAPRTARPTRAPAVLPTAHRGPALTHVRVRDAMHPGAFSCRVDTPLKDVVAIMAHYRIHALVVLDTEGRGVAGVVSDQDVLAAAHHVTGTAAQAAATEPVTIAADEPLDRAARLMAEHAVGHLIVLDPAHGHPIGMLSTLDVAAVIAAGRVDE